MSLDAVAAWAGIFLCLSQSAMLSGLNLACFSVSRLQLEMEASRNNADAVKVLRLRKDSNFLLLDANAFLRTAFATSNSDIDPHDYCVEPVVTRHPDDTLERVLTRGNLSENHSPDRGIILLFGESTNASSRTSTCSSACLKAW
jgi:hypothetical protein